MKHIKGLLIVLLLIIPCVVSSYGINQDTASDLQIQLINDLSVLKDIEKMEHLASDLEQHLRAFPVQRGFIQGQYAQKGNISTRAPHHQCGDKDASCKICYHHENPLECGCVVQVYQCCCGAIMGGKKYYCPDHP